MKLKRSILKIIANYHLHAWKILLHGGLLIYWVIIGENTASWGTPDILGYNRNRHFFTVELKVTKTNKVRLSPHQIAFHVKHPDNTFILVKALSLNSIKLYEGKVIKELDTQGLRLEACSSGLEACFSRLAACGLPPAAA